MQSLETSLAFETEFLRDRDEAWDLRDRDSKKRVSRHVSRPRPSLETPSQHHGCTKSFLKWVHLPIAPDGVFTYRKSKFALKYTNGKRIPSGFSNFYCYRVVLSAQKNFKSFFNISGRLVAAWWSPTAKNIVSGPLVQLQRPAQNPDH